MLREVFLSLRPTLHNLIERMITFDLRAKLVCSGDHVEWQPVVNIFVRRLFPLKLVRIKIADGFDDGDASDDWLE